MKKNQRITMSSTNSNISFPIFLGVSLYFSIKLTFSFSSFFSTCSSGSYSSSKASKCSIFDYVLCPSARGGSINSIYIIWRMIWTEYSSLILKIDLLRTFLIKETTFIKSATKREKGFKPIIDNLSGENHNSINHPKHRMTAEIKPNFRKKWKNTFLSLDRKE